MSQIDDKKGRYWTCIMYPDSAPDDWISELNIMGIQWACSPLHDKDNNPTGDQKKPHWHLILCWDGPTTYNNVDNIMHGYFKGAHVKRLISVIGMYRYFTHKDNPEKYQYNESDIKCYCGFNISNFEPLHANEILIIQKAIVDMIVKDKITSYTDLILKCYDLDFSYFEVVCKHTLFFNTCCTDIWKKMHNLKKS